VGVESRDLWAGTRDCVSGQVDGGVWSAGVVVEIAGVGPVFGGFDQASGDGVLVHVVELFEKLPGGEDVEIVVAGLPEGFGVGLLRDGEFQGLEGFGEGFGGGFAEEKVDVLGHKDVAVDVEVVTFAGLLDRLFEEGVVMGEMGFPVVAAEGDEVEVALCLVTLEA